MHVNRTDRLSRNGSYFSRYHVLLGYNFGSDCPVLIEGCCLIITPHGLTATLLQMRPLASKNATCSGMESGPWLWASQEAESSAPPEPLTSSYPVSPPPHAGIQEFTQLFPVTAYQTDTLLIATRTPVGGFWYFPPELSP